MFIAQRKNVTTNCITYKLHQLYYFQFCWKMFVILVKNKAIENNIFRYHFWKTKTTTITKTITKTAAKKCPKTTSQVFFQCSYLRLWNSNCSKRYSTEVTFGESEIIFPILPVISWSDHKTDTGKPSWYSKP